jgi:hypothetical protein
MGLQQIFTSQREFPVQRASASLALFDRVSANGVNQPVDFLHPRVRLEAIARIKAKIPTLPSISAQAELKTAYSILVPRAGATGA